MEKRTYNFSNLNISLSLANKSIGGMTENPGTNPSKGLSKHELAAEWEEVEAAKVNPHAFKPLYDRYHTAIFRYVYRRTNDQQLSADITSVVFMKILQKLDRYSFQGVPFSALLYRVASNEVVQHYRQSSKNRTVAFEDYKLDDIIDSAYSDNDKEASIKAMIHCLDELKENDLQLIELRFFEKRAFKEIAEILEITENNAKVKTYRILERLKKKIINQLDHK